MKILSIGNSFSQDAQRYLHALAKCEGVNVKTVNLLIGGCPLKKHYINMLDDNKAYFLEFNGVSTGFSVSIRDALTSDEWDVITLQQASPLSGHFDSYTPYIEALAEYIRKYCPKAKLMIHETWAYEDGSERIEKFGFDSAKAMIEAIKSSYRKAAELIGADGLIPAGEAMYRATELGIEKIHRDSFHASLGAGRYLLALTWFKYLTGKDISENSFTELDDPVTDEERKIVISAVNDIVK